MATSRIAYWYLLLLLCVTLNVAMWFYTHKRFEKWPNVPPAPTENSLAASFLGDKALAYRVWGLALQNFGNTGGNYEPLKNYNYTSLGQWFNLLDSMDPHSDFVPLLAAYYFSATQTPLKQLPPVISYLEKVGSRPEGEKWRWLAQAMYLERHKMHNMNEALRLSKKLGDMYRPGMPAWTLQTQALITDKMGDKQAAYAMLKVMLSTQTDQMDPAEVYFMVDYICRRILNRQQAQQEKVCETLPK